MTTLGICHDSTRARKKQLEELGVESIRDIPDDFELTEIQRRAATCVQTGEPWFDSEGLKTELASLKYPSATSGLRDSKPGVPRFRGHATLTTNCRFSGQCMSQREPGAEPEHYEFLATDASDPRREFIASLCDALGESGSIVVYNQRSSRSGFQNLPLVSGVRGSDQAHSSPPVGFASRRSKAHVYHPAFAGSYSLKSVLPALVPEMTYEGMAVRERAGCGAGLGIADAWKRGSSRARQDQEGSAGLLRAGHAGIVKTPRSSQAKHSVILRYRTILFWRA